MTGIGFTGSPLDRDDVLRNDPLALAAALKSPQARLLRMIGLEPELSDEWNLIWDDVPEGGVIDNFVFLGLLDDAPCFAALPPRPADGKPAPPSWRVLTTLSDDQAAIWGTAKSVIDWHWRHGFCAVCGSGSTIFRGGWARRCDSCGAEHFPRVDPVVIMLAVSGDRALVGRQASFPANRYSALAGFIEPGESMEEAVRREIYEEAGIRCGAVHYVASQPWPFPSSLMIACIAEAESEEITLDTRELEHAFWVEKSAVQQAFDPGCDDPVFLIPPVQAIAHHLFLHWAFHR